MRSSAMEGLLQHRQRLRGALQRHHGLLQHRQRRPRALQHHHGLLQHRQRFEALYANTTGSYNTASGAYALFSNTTGSNNTASGFEALYANTTGSTNTASGAYALFSTTTGSYNTASGFEALYANTTGSDNTASGAYALLNNTTGSNNTAIGYGADVSAGNLVNATAIGAGAVVNASNKIRLGNAGVTVIEGQVPFTSSSDKTKKENFRPVDGEEVLAKIRGFALTSWNFIGHDPKAFRHYGPMAQDFFAAFGHDDVGQIGSETTINAGDMAGILLSAVQALEQRTAELQQKEAQMAGLAAQVDSPPREARLCGDGGDAAGSAGAAQAPRSPDHRREQSRILAPGGVAHGSSFDADGDKGGCVGLGLLRHGRAHAHCAHAHDKRGQSGTPMLD